MRMANTARTRAKAATTTGRPNRTPVPFLDAETHIGANVRRLRKGRGWSQQQLANATNRQLPTEFGVKLWQQPTMAKIESTTNRRPVTVDEALALARALDVPLHELLLEPSAAGDAETERLWAEYVAGMQAAMEAANQERELERKLRDRGVDVAARMDAWITDVTGRQPADIAAEGAQNSTAGGTQ